MNADGSGRRRSTGSRSANRRRGGRLLPGQTRLQFQPVARPEARPEAAGGGEQSSGDRSNNDEPASEEQVGPAQTPRRQMRLVFVPTPSPAAPRQRSNSAGNPLLLDSIASFEDNLKEQDSDSEPASSTAARKEYWRTKRSARTYFPKKDKVPEESSDQPKAPTATAQQTDETKLYHGTDEMDVDDQNMPAAPNKGDDEPKVPATTVQQPRESETHHNAEKMNVKDDENMPAASKEDDANRGREATAAKHPHESKTHRRPHEDVYYIDRSKAHITIFDDDPLPTTHYTSAIDQPLRGVAASHPANRGRDVDGNPYKPVQDHPVGGSTPASAVNQLPKRRPPFPLGPAYGEGVPPPSYHIMPGPPAHAFAKAVFSPWAPGHGPQSNDDGLPSYTASTKSKMGQGKAAGVRSHAGNAKSNIGHGNPAYDFLHRPAPGFSSDNLNLSNASAGVRGHTGSTKSDIGQGNPAYDFLRRPAPGVRSDKLNLSNASAGVRGHTGSTKSDISQGNPTYNFLRRPAPGVRSNRLNLRNAATSVRSNAGNAKFNIDQGNAAKEEHTGNAKSDMGQGNPAYDFLRRPAPGVRSDNPNSSNAAAGVRSHTDNTNTGTGQGAAAKRFVFRNTAPDVAARDFNLSDSRYAFLFTGPSLATDNKNKNFNSFHRRPPPPTISDSSWSKAAAGVGSHGGNTNTGNDQGNTAKGFAFRHTAPDVASRDFDLRNAAAGQGITALGLGVGQAASGVGSGNLDFSNVGAGQGNTATGFGVGQAAPGGSVDNAGSGGVSDVRNDSSNDALTASGKRKRGASDEGPPSSRLRRSRRNQSGNPDADGKEPDNA